MFRNELLYFARPEEMTRATSPDFWRGLCPDLTISPEPFANLPPPPPLEVEESSRLVEQVVADGYFQTAPLASADEMRPLAAAVSAVVAAGYHPVFATVYDEVWQFLARLDNVLEPILGKGFQVIPDLWLWHVGADPQRTGWVPHRDGQYTDPLRPDGRPTLLTVWIPFTDATPLNSCIYALPLSLDPNYPDALGERTVDQLQDIRALPAPAGAVLGWNQYLLHWGSRASARPGQPRISWALYFQSGDVAPFDPLARELRGPLPFEMRLAFVGAALHRYLGRFPLPAPLQSFLSSARDSLSIDAGSRRPPSTHPVPIRRRQ